MPPPCAVTADPSGPGGGPWHSGISRPVLPSPCSPHSVSPRSPGEAELPTPETFSSLQLPGCFSPVCASAGGGGGAYKEPELCWQAGLLRREPRCSHSQIPMLSSTRSTGWRQERRDWSSVFGKSLFL